MTSRQEARSTDDQLRVARRQLDEYAVRLVDFNSIVILNSIVQTRARLPPKYSGERDQPKSWMNETTKQWTVLHVTYITAFVQTSFQPQ